MKLFHARYVQPSVAGAVIVHEEDFYLPDVTSVRRQLRARGFWPIAIVEQKPPMFEWMDVRSRAWQIQLLRALRFQSATASTGTALLNIIEGEQDPRRRLAFLPTRTVLKGGGSFSEALRELKLMDAPTMAIIAAGERAGDLKGVIQHAIEHVEEKGKQYKVFMAAMGWLSFDIFSVITSIWGVQFGFIPHLRAKGINNASPEDMAKFEQGMNLVSGINISLLTISTTVVVLGVFFGVSYWVNRHKPRHFVSRLMMKMPIISAYLRNVALQDTCKLVARLLRGKVPLDEALKIIIDSTIEPATRTYWLDCQSRIMAGVEPSKALARWPLSKAERDQIVTIQSVDQLSEVYEAIAIERGMMSKADQRKIVQLGIASLMTFGGATVMTVIYLLTLQNQGIFDSLKSVTS